MRTFLTPCCAGRKWEMRGDMSEWKIVQQDPGDLKEWSETASLHRGPECRREPFIT